MSQNAQALPNRLRQDLLTGKKLIGCWSALGSPITTEVLGLAGFDWLLLDAEHAPNDVLSLIPQLMALKDSMSAPVVRPPSNDRTIIKRLLDAGFHNFIIPFVETAEEAQAAVAATRYPPHGNRGVSVAHRSNKYGTIADYHEMVNKNVSVIVQIETPEAAARADQIAEIDGVDCLFIGPSDLAASCGHMGHASHPDVQQLITRVFRVAERAGKAAGILAPIEADARAYIELGATFVAVGSDLGLLKKSSQDLRQQYM